MKICGRDLKVQGRLLKIGQIDGEGFEFVQDPEAAIESIRSLGARVDLFTFMQKVTETSPKYSYPMEWGNFAALQISTFENWWKHQVDGKTRNMVRRAEKKGLLVREVPFDHNLVRGIWELYNECPIRQGRPFPHYGKDIETVRQMSATFLETSVFLGAFLDDTLIGFAKLTCDASQTQAGIMHILSMVEHRDKAPTNALIAQAVRTCDERAIPYLVYSTFTYGKKRKDSLSDFKERNGFHRVNVPRYFVPLTRFGWIALRLGLHRGFLNQLPEPLVTKLRNLRSEWYSRKPHSQAEAL